LSTKGPRRKKWDEDFHLVGLDSRRPPPLRRYFDRVPGESTLPKGLRGEGSKKGGPGKSFDPPPHLQARKTWVETHHQTVSPDNEALHPHLRTYFDRRGLEACYRQRPHIDRDTKKLRPRTPQRPSTREKIMRFKSLSEPSLQGSSVMSGQSSDGEEEEMGVEGRHKGGTNWGRRCLEHNSCQIKVKPKKVDGIVQKIPWVKDHHVTVATDNEGLNPMLRHFFDQDGLESSFRNRGMHYGRKPLDTWGVEELLKKKMKERQRANSNSSWDSVPSSLLEKLSYTSLVDGSTPGGLPVVGGNAYSGGGSAGVSGTGSGRNIGEGYAGQGENL